MRTIIAAPETGIIMPRRQRGSGPEEEAATIHSMPRELQDQVLQLARRQSVNARDIYIEALRKLSQDVRDGKPPAWLAAERGHPRLMMWLPVEESADFRRIAQDAKQSLSVVLLAAVKAYLDQQELDA